MELDYLPIIEIFSSVVFITHEDCTPFHDGGVWRGLPPHYCPSGGPGGAVTLHGAPPGGGLGAMPPNRKIEKNAM